MYNHFAQFMEYHNLPLKSEAIKRRLENYEKSAPLLDPPSQRIEIPFEGIMLSGNLRFPKSDKGIKKVPCAILIGGLESAKEGFYTFENLCLARGLATLSFDGPGQGETHSKMKARPDFEKATSAVIDFIHKEKQDQIDVSRIGVIGRSTGGYYAPRSAAFEKRIKACVAWAVIYDFGLRWSGLTDTQKDGFTYVSGKKNWDESREYFKLFTLRGAAEKITCPLYILHGMLDNSIGIEQPERVAREASGPTKLVIEKDGIHCCHNMAHVVRPRMADWMRATLLD
ncbi:MAG: alpha/beta hydrolase family protein [Nitrososphaerales archaeon]